MTSPDDLLELATPYALHALSDAEATELEHRVASAPPAIAHAFADEVRSIREAMAVVSASTAVEPPAELRQRLLAAVAEPMAPVVELPRRRWRTAVLAAAAAVIIGLGGVGVWTALRPTPTVAEQVLAASDVAVTKGAIPTGGEATFAYSRDLNAGVLTMTDVAPPVSGTVYQMWLLPPSGDPVSAGTMGPGSVQPVTQAVVTDLGDSSALAFTVEPGAGSTRPTGAPFASLPLT